MNERVVKMVASQDQLSAAVRDRLAGYTHDELCKMQAKMAEIACDESEPEHRRWAAVFGAMGLADHVCRMTEEMIDD